MNARIASIAVLLLSAPAHGQGAGDDPMARLSRSAEQDLQASIVELDRLREQIASEKLPLAQELTTLEEQISQRRREHDRITRLVDESSLELGALRAETKARQDELDYVGNLLDEYTRTFESKVHPSELQILGAAIADAKQAVEDRELTLLEKLRRQLALVEVTIQRSFDAVGGLRFAGVGVDAQGTLIEGRIAIVGPAALFSAAGRAAGLLVPQAGSPNPLIRPLDDAAQAGLVALVEHGVGFLPLDPSRGGALKALLEKTSLVHIFEKGGPIMWPLLAASVLALGTVLERLIFLAGERRRRDPRALERLLASVESGDLDDAVRLAKSCKDYVVRALAYALDHREGSLSSALLYSQAQELKRFRRGIPILDTVITLAPLLGLLGTVTGMMGSFSLIGGELSAPGAITGGIAEALIATAFGLGIAITALLPFNFLNTKLDEARHEIESAATQLELLVHPHAERSPAAPCVLEPIHAGSGGGRS